MTAIEPLKIIIGYDPRQAISYTVLQHSILRHASVPVSIIPLVIDTLPVSNSMCGLTPFTYTRYLVPWLCGFSDKALFMDSDIIVRGDIKELFDAATGAHPIWCVHHKKRFEWASVMLFECGHPGNACLTPEYVTKHHKELPALGWFTEPNLLPADRPTVGELPREWNHLVLYDRPRSDAKLIHFTAGIPVWNETQGVEHSDLWKEEAETAMAVIGWEELMGGSVHVPVVRQHLIATGRIKDQGRDDGSASP